MSEYSSKPPESSESEQVLKNLSKAFGQENHHKNFTRYVNPSRNYEQPDYLIGFEQIRDRFLRRLSLGAEDSRFEVFTDADGNRLTRTPELKNDQDWIGMVDSAAKIPKEKGGLRLKKFGTTSVRAIYSMGFEDGDKKPWVRASAGVDQRDPLYEDVRVDEDLEKIIEPKHGMLAGELDAHFAGEMLLEVKTMFGIVVSVKLREINDDSGGFAPRARKDKVNLALNQLRVSGLSFDENSVFKSVSREFRVERTNNLKNFEDLSDTEVTVLTKRKNGQNKTKLRAEGPIFLNYSGAGSFLWIDDKGKPYMSAIAYVRDDGDADYDSYDGGKSLTSTDRIWQKRKDGKLQMTMGREVGNTLLVPDDTVGHGYRSRISRQQMKVVYDPKTYEFEIENLSNSSEMGVRRLKPKVEED